MWMEERLLHHNAGARVSGVAGGVVKAGKAFKWLIVAQNGTS